MICSKRLKSSLLTSFVKLCSERQTVLILDGSHSVAAIGTQHVRTNYTQHSKPDWDKAVSEAEKIVGYPTSFLSLRWLLSDEIANVALHLRKLVGSNHPLLKTAKDVLYSNRHNVQAWGLIVLLISKAAGHASVDALKEDKAAGVLHSQRALAEVTEMIRTSHLVHKGLVNIYPGLYPQPAVLNDMLFGNKIALLGGDYLLGNCCAELASLRNQELVEIMSSSVRDLAEAEFLGLRDMQNNPLPPRFARTTLSLENYFAELLNTAAVSDWRHRNILSAASLLGSSCKGTLMLADHGPELQQHAFDFGKHLALASQACLELEPFNAKSDSNYATTTERFSLTSAPVLFHLEHDPSLYEEIAKGHKSVNDVDYKKVHEIVSNGPGPALTKELQREHSRCAMNELHVFQENDARTALSNIIVAMEEII